MQVCLNITEIVCGIDIHLRNNYKRMFTATCSWITTSCAKRRYFGHSSVICDGKHGSKTGSKVSQIAAHLLVKLRRGSGTPTTVYSNPHAQLIT